MPLDQALPTFTLVPSSDPSKAARHSTFYHSISGSDPEPTYLLRKPDPATNPAARNAYAAALFDAYNPDILYGEVLIKPKWTQPQVPGRTADGRIPSIPPPPEPTMPTDFTIQLYNPDQQIHFVQQRNSGLLSTPGMAARWDFSVPQDTFREPSASSLDRSQDDPGAADTTPRTNFCWRRDAKISIGGKDATCYMTGKSTDDIAPSGGKRKKQSKEPDIAIALFKGLRECTVYEPNLYRVDLEDPKGFEVLLLLGAAVIKDVYSGGNIRTIFNIADVSDLVGNSRRRSSANSASGIRPPSTFVPSASPPPLGENAAYGAGVNDLYSQAAKKPSSYPPLNTNHSRFDPNSPLSPQQATALQPPSAAPPPPADPLTQWQIDTETARLKAAQDAEARRHAQEEERRRLEREKVAAEDERRIKKMLDAEERQRQRKLREVDKETERLRRMYGPQGPGGTQHPQAQQPSRLQKPQPPPRHAQSSSAPAANPFPNPPPQQQSRPGHGGSRPSRGGHAPSAPAINVSSHGNGSSPMSASNFGTDYNYFYNPAQFFPGPPQQTQASSSGGGLAPGGGGGGGSGGRQGKKDGFLRRSFMDLRSMTLGGGESSREVGDDPGRRPVSGVW